MVTHAGNAINALTLEEHDGLLNAKRSSLVSAATIFAVVNTLAAGAVTVKQGDSPWISSLPSGVTVYQGTQPWNSLGTVTANGLVTLAPSPNFIGIVTQANQPALIDGVGKIGFVTVSGIGTVTLADPRGYIGLVTVGGIGTLTLSDPKGFIGLVTIGGIGTLTLADPKGFIGLVTAVIGNASVAVKNAGTTKTLQIFPVIISTGSAATVYVPTSKFYLTSLILNSNSTVRVNVRSGATYLTGNASVGIELNPGSGWVENGSPDSPLYFALANAAPIVIEKTDYSGVISRVSGKLVLFDE